MSDLTRVRLRARPHVGARVPGWVPRVLVGVIGLWLCMSQFPLGFWFWVGIVVVAVAAVFPATPAAWALMLLAGASMLLRTPSPADARIYILIATIHLLQLVAAYARVVPVRSWMQLRAFAAPLRRFIIVQVPAQIIAALALFAFSPRAGNPHPAAIPILGVVAAVALVVLTLVLIVPLIRERRS